MKLTILMYHRIDVPPPGARHPGNYVTPAAFAEQIDALRAWGYRTIDLADWLAYRKDQRHPIPPKPLLLTFDDGYACFGRNAWPLLRASGFGAWIFLVSGQIGGTNAWDAAERQEPLLDADAILALARDGVRIGAHTVTHAPLAKLPADRAYAELVESRESIEALLGRTVDVLAYPFSNQSRRVRRLARRAGYRAAMRGTGRMNARRVDPFALRRIKVEHEWSLGDFRRRLEREHARVF